MIDAIIVVSGTLWLLLVAGVCGYYYGRWKHRQTYGKYNILVRQSRKPQKFTLSRILGKFIG